MANSSKKSAAGAKTRHRGVSLSIARLAREPLPRMPLARIAEAALPRGYSLSLVIAGDALTRKLNAERRGKSYIPNVLSFPLSPSDGEIFLNLRQARREFASGKAEGTWTAWVALLIIHSLLHLKGMDHGRTMDRSEARLLRRFGYSARLRE